MTGTQITPDPDPLEQFRPALGALEVIDSAYFDRFFGSFSVKSRRGRKVDISVNYYPDDDD